MGGGDLNSKKSWHPNTMKNQERVWKAEQAAAEEIKRIQELQRERAEERDRAELNELAKRSAGASGSGSNRLHWMYDDKPNKKTQQEEYLLGKSIEKNYDQPDKEQDSIPAVVRRVVGSSMMLSSGDSQVDLARKIREDPLLLVKERERAARAALLNNPLHRKKLTELLRKEQEQKKEIKTKKAKRKEDLDNQLAAKLSSLGGNNGVDVAALLASVDSFSSSEDEKKPTKKKKKKHAKAKKLKKSKEKKKMSLDDCDLSEKKSRIQSKYDMKCRNKSYYPDSESDTELKSKFKNTKVQKYETRKRKSDDYDSETEYRNKRKKANLSGSRKSNRGYNLSDDDSNRVLDRNRSPQNYRRASPIRKNNSSVSNMGISHDNRRQLPENERRSMSPERKRYKTDTYWNTKKTGLSEQERVARLAEMAAAGAEREVQRESRVAQQRAADAKESEEPRRPHTGGNEARALPDSLESRIHSNRHYIQRDKRHMNENFARR
ncbi:pre-mRNA-splicing factor CWC25 homolog [Hyposmocoma kahamanoa]|uniref:pre-mRNA-splicing factor CWC25 homolog n=1 Tax=Hyposmocoma kahamanoa TaxID=1477025 RepID=UPI000E6D6226|nr:pre-mRNA-splicing factor CWC25 homolog [Hyposmocoma kahamanoa]